MNKTQLYEMISELLDEAQWGGFTGGAAPLDEPPLDSGPMSPEQQQKVFDMLVDTGSDPEQLKASGDYPDVIEENIMNIKNIIKEELQNYLNEASASQCKDMLDAGEISPDQYQACLDHFEKDYGDVEDTGERALQEAVPFRQRSAAKGLEKAAEILRSGRDFSRDALADTLDQIGAALLSG